MEKNVRSKLLCTGSYPCTVHCTYDPSFKKTEALEGTPPGITSSGT